MALPFRLQELAYSAESAFAENAESPGSNTWTTRIPIIGSPRVSIPQDRVRDGGLRSRQNEESVSHRGARDIAELEFTTYWAAHGTTTAGALTQTWLQDLLSDGLGGGNVAAVGTTASTGSTTTLITGTNLTTFVAGSILRVGVKGDGRSDGYAAPIGVITDATPDTASLLIALPTAPNSGDVIYAAQVAYPDESVSATLGTKRFLVSHVSTGLQHHLMGGQLSALAFNIVHGQLPTVTLTYRFAYWARQADTTPSARTLESHFTGPVAGGSFSLADFGSTTRTALNAANIRFTVNMGLEPIIGPVQNVGGTYQFVNGWQRSMAKADLSFDVPWDTGGFESNWDEANPTHKQFMFASNHTDGRAVGFYMPRAFIVGQRPSGPTEVNAQDYVTVNYTATESTTTTTELTRSNFRLFMA